MRYVSGCGNAHMTIFARFAQIYSLLALYGSTIYACSYTTALSPGIIPSFAVLLTEKQHC